MSVQGAVNLTLDAAMILMITAIYLPEIGNLRSVNYYFYMVMAGLLHVFAMLFDCLTIYFELLGDLQRGYYGASLLAEILFVGSSAWMLYKAVYSDAKGYFQSSKERETPVSFALVLKVFVPLFFGLVIQYMMKGFYVLSFSYGFSILLVTAHFRYSVEDELIRREKQNDLNRSKLLLEQMQPHFIFNSLMSIQDLCYADGEKAAKYIEDFSGYLRGNIDALTSAASVPFETELAHIKEYISLERAGTDVEFDVIYELGSRNFLIPALTVQPIVENAIKYGALSHRDGTGYVRLRTEKKGNFISIMVEDNGLSEAVLTEKQKNRKSVGIQNVRERLAVQCGGTLEIARKSSVTRATIVIPAKEVQSYAYVNGR